jgi:branched-chain amino acid aminotransferase
MPTYDSVPESFNVPWVWLDGELVPAAQATVPLMTQTLHYGVGVFEGIRSYKGELGSAVFRLPEHIERLYRSAGLVRMEIPFSIEDVIAGCVLCMADNGLAEGYLRPIAFVDDGKRGLSAPRNRVRVAVVVWPWGAYLGEEGIQNGIRAQVSGWQRMSPRSLLPKGKICGQYVNSILAKRDAVTAGFDEAIMLDHGGRVAEASGENLFLVEGKTVVTPPRSAPILEGITRASVMELAAGLGFEVKEEPIARDRLYAADEVFLTGTAAEVTPVRQIDNRDIGSGTRGPVTEQLQTLYMETVRGKYAAYNKWLTPYEAKRREA